MLVTLGEAFSGVDDFSAGRKNGSSFHDVSGGGGFEGRSAGGGTEDCAGAGGRAGEALKNWVKLPSAEAESDTPGEENPLARDGPADGGAGRAASSTGLAGGVKDGFTAGTKIRVNSPCCS